MVARRPKFRSTLDRAMIPSNVRFLLTAAALLSLAPFAACNGPDGTTPTCTIDVTANGIDAKATDGCNPFPKCSKGDPTLCCEAFKPAPGAYEVTFLHSRTKQPVTVAFELPPGNPEVSFVGHSLLFDYGRHEVEIRFQVGGKVKVTKR